MSSSKMFTSLESLPSKTSNASLLTLEDCSDPVQLFHNRFGHVGPRLVSRISIPNDMPTNLKSKLSLNLSKRCEVCMSCKQVEKISRGPCEKMDEPLKLFHSDTWGKCRVMGLEGNFYFVSFTDDFSRHCEVYPMKPLSQVPSIFKRYKKQRNSKQVL